MHVERSLCKLQSGLLRILLRFSFWWNPAKSQNWSCWAREGLLILSTLVEFKPEHSCCLGLEHLCFSKIAAPYVAVFLFLLFLSRTRPTQRTRAPGTASRTWPPSCPSCLGSRRTGWNCTIRTGTPPRPTHPTRPRATFRLRCEDATDVQLLTDNTHVRALTPRHAATTNSFQKATHEWIFCKRFSHTPLPVSTGALRQIRYCICLPPQQADAEKGDCSTIYFRKKKKRLLKRKNRGSTRLGLIFKMNFKRRNKTKVRKNLFPGKKRKKKCLDFFSAGEKKRKHQQGNVFKTVLIWGGAGSRWIFLQRWVLFIARRRKCH